MSKEKSAEEVREEFLEHTRNLIAYWNDLDKGTTKEKLEGLAFSIMSMLDGNSKLPSFIVAPLVHKDDKQFCINAGEDYYPENYDSNIKCDIAGSLHELLFKK